MLTILADENIINLDEYMAHHDIHLIKVKGRDINQHAIKKYNPDALFIRSVTPINSDTITDFGKVSFVGSATIGTDHVNITHLNKHGISFSNAGGCSKHSVAQYVLVAISHLYPEYYDKHITIGIIGLGNIGSTLAGYAQQLGWHVLGHDPLLATSNINNSSLDKLLKNSDVISIHTPLTQDGNHPTHHLLNKNNLSKIKNNTLIINTARGKIIHHDDLMTAINQQNLKVVLDVFPHEPNIDAALLNRLAIATPHIAGYTLEGKLRGTDMIYQAFCRHFHLPIMQHLSALLPPNPLSWADFKASIKQLTPISLARFYDIVQDDVNLRALGQHGVEGASFDQLRKNYALRHEWLY